MHLGNAQINLSVLFLNNPDAKQSLTKTVSATFKLENDTILKVKNASFSLSLFDNNFI